MVVLQFICERCGRLEGKVIHLTPGDTTWINEPEGWDREKQMCGECLEEIEELARQIEASDREHEG